MTLESDYFYKYVLNDNDYDDDDDDDEDDDDDDDSIDEHYEGNEFIWGFRFTSGFLLWGLF